MSLLLIGCGKSADKKKTPEAKNEPEAAKNAPKDIAIATTQATSTRSGENGQKLWIISWESANLGIQDGKQFGSMKSVKGTTFEAGKEAATFSSDLAEADKAEDRLILEGDVRVESFKTPKAVMTAKKVEWLPQLKVFKASGDVLIDAERGIVGPIDHIYVSSDLSKMGTSPEYFKK